MKKGGALKSLVQMNNFREIIDLCNLVDPGWGGGKFT